MNDLPKFEVYVLASRPFAEKIYGDKFYFSEDEAELAKIIWKEKEPELVINLYKVYISFEND